MSCRICDTARGPPRSSQNPIRSWTSLKTIKRNKSPYLKSCTCLEVPACCMNVEHRALLGKAAKRKVSDGFSDNCSMQSEKRWLPGTAARCSTVGRLGENRNKANCFTLRRRIATLRFVNSEIRWRIQIFTWNSPKGSCHLVELTWVTHLLRMAIANCEVDCIRRAKKQTQHDNEKMRPI